MSPIVYDSQLLRQIFDNAKTGIAICNAKDNRIEMVNPAFAQMHGYEQHELIGSMPGEIFAPECMQKVADYEEKSVCSIDDISFETTHIRKDGSSINVLVHITLIKDPTGTIIQRIANIIDISTQKQQELLVQKQEEELQEKTNILTSLVAAIPDFIWMKDEQGIYLSCNKAYGDFFDTEIEKIIGKSDYDFFTKEEAEACLLSDNQAIQTGALVLCQENVTYRKTGKSGIWEIRKMPVMKQDGTLFGVLGVARDVTETVHMQNELLAQRQEYRHLADSMPGFAYKYYYDSEGKQKFLYASNGVAEIYGVTPEEVLQDVSIIKQRIHSDDKVRIEKAIKKARERMKPLFLEFRASHPQKGEIWLERRVVPQNNEEEGSVVWHGITLDITYRKRQEELLRQKEEEFRTLAQNINIPIYRYDRDFRRTYINAAVEVLTDKTASELLGNTPKEAPLVHPDYSDVLMQSLQKVFATKQADSVELLFVLSDKTKKYFLHQHIPEFDEQNNVESIIAIGHDITAQKELAEREEMFRTLAENSPDIIMRYDRHAKRIYANPAFIKQTGIPYECAFNIKPVKQWGVYLDMINMGADEYERRVKQVFQRAQNDTFVLEWLRHNDCTNVANEIHLVAEKNKEGDVVGVLAIGHNITNKLANERQLKQSIEFSQSIIEAIPDLLFEVDENGYYLNFWSHDKTLALTNKEQLVGKRIDDVLSAEASQTAYEALAEAKQNGVSFGKVYKIAYPNQKERWFELSISKRAHKSYLALARDITERKFIERKIEYLAHHDILTALPNRMFAQEKAESILQEAKQISTKAAFLFIDLDGFKTINDSLGHAVGDMLLKTVTSRLAYNAGTQNILSRQGGDEFLLVMPNIDAFDEVEVLTRKLLQTFEQPFDVHNRFLSITASIGIAVYPDHGHTFEQLVQNADTAMYKAKERGKNTYYFFTQEMKHNLIGLYHMQNELKRAINQQEFLLHYQPQIDLGGNKIVGAEALIRWRNPSVGMVPPNSFISIAESSGLIVQIGEWVVYEACKQAAVWNKQGKDIVVAVNISAVQFKRGNLLEVVKNALLVSELHPRNLELELTESILINDTENVLQTVKAIKELGVQLSIDDFGTGYPSLAYLKRFAVDKLKIDQSFVKDITNDKENESIVKAIINMAKSFNLKSIAEGVEDEDVLALLHQFGCDEVQGYYFAKPMEAEHFSAYYDSLF